MWVLLIALILLAGIIGGAGSLNYASVNSLPVYAVGGLGAIAVAVCFAIDVYRKHLK